MFGKDKPLADVPPSQTSPLSYAVAEQDRDVIAMVQDALRERRLRLAFQPVVLSTDTSIIGFHEGLIRVLDPAGRTIPAREFITEVEAHQIGREIDCAALNMGMHTLSQNPQLRLSINMSARSIGYPKWMNILRHGLKTYPGLGERLILEISESSAMMVPELVISFMKDLQREGVAFAMDNFGAGLTAIRYFKEFYFDILKIDGQFIRNIHTNPDNQVLASALLSVCKQFDMLCVAESVETAADAEFLQAIGIDCLQGYLFGAPTVSPVWVGAQNRHSA